MVRFSIFRQLTTESRKSEQSSLPSLKLETLVKSARYSLNPKRLLRFGKAKKLGRRKTDSSASETESQSLEHLHGGALYRAPIPPLWDPVGSNDSAHTNSSPCFTAPGASISTPPCISANRNSWQSETPFATDLDEETGVGAAVYPPLLFPEDNDLIKDQHTPIDAIDSLDELLCQNPNSCHGASSPTGTLNPHLLTSTEEPEEIVNAKIIGIIMPPWTELVPTEYRSLNKSQQNCDTWPAYLSNAPLPDDEAASAIEDGKYNATAGITYPADGIYGPSLTTGYSFSDTQKTSVASVAGENHYIKDCIDPQLLVIDHRNDLAHNDLSSRAVGAEESASSVHNAGSHLSADSLLLPGTFPDRIELLDGKNPSPLKISESKDSIARHKQKSRISTSEKLGEEADISKLICRHCGKGYKTVQHLKKHERRKHSPTVKCPSCSRLFPFRSEMEKHHRERHEPPRWSCPHSRCKNSENGEAKQFVSKWNLDRHLKTCQEVVE